MVRRSPRELRSVAPVTSLKPVRRHGWSHWQWMVRAVIVAVLFAVGIGYSKSRIQGQESSREEDLRTPSEEQLEDPLKLPVVGIVFEGNTSIPDAAMLKYIKTPIGRPATVQQIRDDAKALYNTRWFLNVEPRTRSTTRGIVLVFHVNERPVVERVVIQGNNKIKEKHLRALTGLKKGSPFDVSANRQSVRRIENHYREKGYYFRKVKLVKGGDPEDREVIIEIEEGPKVLVGNVKFIGNESFSGPLLKTKIMTKLAMFRIPGTKVAFLGGLYDPSSIPNDVASLKEYYNSLGYFDATIEPDVVFSEDKSRVFLNYHIHEGERYRVRSTTLIGNSALNHDELREEAKLHDGDFFNARFLNHDIEKMRAKYGEQGRLFADVKAVPRFLEQPGEIDLELQIDEDKPYRIRKINVHIRGEYPHTKDTVAIQRMLVNPGDLANPNLIKASQRRLEGAQVFERGGELGPRIDIQRVEEPAVPDLQLVGAETAVRGQTTDSPIPQPQNPIYGTSPQGDPFSNPLFQETEPPGWVDLDVGLSEARTGRLMFGVGVNSDNGVVGSFVLEETNFDILRPPTSPGDLFNGTAWRGGGQQFRLEAVPGNLVSRYMLSWTDPYFMDTNYSVTTSGFYFNRFYPDWDEERLGGRIGVGRQLTQQISVNFALRLEDVTLSNPDIPTPNIVTKAVGSNFLSTARVGIAHDTRDAPFLPAAGHLLQFNVEQAFGDFVYPRLEADGSQFFTLYSRPDGGGRHILSVNGHLGWTDNDTPVFERYFAGGFQTFRGFAFRGVSPEQTGTKIGGRFLALGGLEYMAPITADDKIQAVAFTDFGSVENTVTLDNFRMSIGAGLRLTVPAMGPAPIALDFAYPILHEDSDERQIFSFYVGFTR
ncbi:MAG: BamA/TamA family outer membrane protein [Planctomycetota bacterium]|nr:BamA/TamA family outer membrane protein [Planctomycetota bacterium]